MARLKLLALLLASQTAAADPAVWHFSPRADSDVWILGSVHYLREQDHPLPRIVDRVYQAADSLVMEIDLDDLEPTAVQLRFMQAAMLTAPTTLAELVGDDLYATTAAAASELGLDLQTFDGFEPWLVALTLMDLGMARLGFRMEQGLEQTLLRRARRDGKPVLGLETTDDQLEIFDGLPLAEQQALLEQTLGEIDVAHEQMDVLMTAWRDGELDVLSRELLAAFDGFPTLYERLVAERNRRWIAEIERLTARPGRRLIVVGALHLVGDGNVIELLAAKGVETTQLSP